MQDEVQRVPKLLSWLQGVPDTDGRMGLFVLTGSQQFALRQGLSQSLAGRIGHLGRLPPWHANLGKRPAAASHPGANA